MVFDMISIVEEQEIVEPAIVTYRTPYVFVVALQSTQSQTKEIARQINGKYKPG